jgi:glycosyltransferase involved in cell wall biosynthesis/GT2 family glycosyltransferase
MSLTESSPTVSVAICLHDSARYVEETLESVLAQTYRCFEVLLVDDGSTDGCADKIESRFRDPRLRILRQVHRGLGHARGVGLAHARGEYVAFLDHDDVWLPHKLEMQVRIAQEQPDLGLVFSDCFFVDGGGTCLGRLSGRYDYASIDLGGTRALRELLFRGCFIDLSTVLGRAEALREAGGFDSRYTYVEDYDMWLRVARKRRIFFVAEPLAKRRIHDGQFTRRYPRLALAEQVHLLRPFARSRTHPADLRKAVGDYLLGQHRDCCRRLLEQRRFAAAARTALGMLRFPDRLADFGRDKLSRTPFGPVAGGMEYVARWTWERVRRLVRGPRPTGAAASATTEVWVDGSPLGEPQTGYFNLVVELIRALLRWGGDGCVVHVVTPAAGRRPLGERLGPEAARLRVHGMTWSFFHWTALHAFLSHWSTSLLVALIAGGLLATGAVPGLRAGGGLLATALGAFLADGIVATLRSRLGRPATPQLARLVRFLSSRAATPIRPFHGPETVEVLVWRGRFRYAGSRKIALIQDLTTRVHPDLHTPGNVAEFEDYLRYALRHADSIGTVSENSRRDIIDRLGVFPDGIHVMPMNVDPIYLRADYSRGVPASHGLAKPYLLCVGTVEPRKNLRRLVRAFERIAREEAAREHVLVLAGPSGWDEGFGRFLVESDAYLRVRALGFVPLEHLPSLYHFASAVVYPSVYEGFGLPVLEAMCCSAVVAAARIHSFPAELVGGGIDFDPYSTEEMADALLAALGMTPDEAAAYRRCARIRAEAFISSCRKAPPLPGLSRRELVEKACV